MSLRLRLKWAKDDAKKLLGITKKVESDIDFSKLNRKQRKNLTVQVNGKTVPLMKWISDQADALPKMMYKDGSAVNHKDVMLTILKTSGINEVNEYIKTCIDIYKDAKVDIDKAIKKVGNELKKAEANVRKEH